MKITKEQLKQIIKEEITEANEPVSRQDFETAINNVDNVLKKYLSHILSRLDAIDSKGTKL